MSAGAVEGHFERKTPWKIHKVFLHEYSPDSLDTCNSEETGLPVLQSLDKPPYSADLATSNYHLLPELRKTIDSPSFFFRCKGHCCRGDLAGRTHF
jgi:hypothetical protein